MEEIVIDLSGAHSLELDSIDVEVSNETLSFTAEGVIQGIDDETLDSVRGKSLTPTEVHFAVDDG